MAFSMTEAPSCPTTLKVTPGVFPEALPLAIGILAGSGVWLYATSLGTDGRIVLIVAIFAVIGWVATRLPDSLVALIAALALVVTGAQPQEALTQTLGQKIVWLLLAAFVIAAVIKEAGLADRLVAPLTRSAPRVLPFFLVTGAAISATAFLLPSTSGRAALLLPVFIGLLAALPDPRLSKPLALLFPTAILLSAGGSLIGAGAHVIAVEAIASSGGPRLSYLDWLVLGAPLAVLSVVAATLLIFVLFVPRDLRQAQLRPRLQSGQITQVQARILFVLMILVALWIGKPLHGLDEAIVALAGAVLLLLPPFCARKPKDVFRSVDVELVLYMAATLMLSVAIIDTGVDVWLARGALALLPPQLATHTTAMVVFLSFAAVAAHLAITSRSARAGILIPALALPMAGLGHDATIAVLITVMGTGFCQTMMASAKPVAIFGMHEDAGFSQRDLIRLALPLAPLKVALLAGFGLWLWPNQLVQLKSPATTHGSIAISAHLPDAPKDSAASRQMSTFEDGIGFHNDLEPVSHLALAVSLRPKARPTDIFTPVTAHRPAAQRPVVVRASPPVVAQLRQDLRRAGRDMRQAGRQIEHEFKRLFR